MCYMVLSDRSIRSHGSCAAFPLEDQEPTHHFLRDAFAAWFLAVFMPQSGPMNCNIGAGTFQPDPQWMELIFAKHVGPGCLSVGPQCYTT